LRRLSPSLLVGHVDVGWSRFAMRLCWKVALPFNLALPKVRGRIVDVYRLYH
jgi:hypothetical protein